MAALAGTAGLAAHAASDEPALGLFGSTAFVLLAAAVTLGRGGLVAPALVLVVAGYAVTMVVRDAEVLDGAAPLVGAALLVVAELAYWSIELVRKADEERPALVRRVGTTIGLGAAALFLGAGVLSAAALPFGGGLAWNVAGVAAAVAALALVARLAAMERSGA